MHTLQLELPIIATLTIESICCSSNIPIIVVLHLVAWRTCAAVRAQVRPTWRRGLDLVHEPEAAAATGPAALTWWPWKCSLTKGKESVYIQYGDGRTNCVLVTHSSSSRARTRPCDCCLCGAAFVRGGRPPSLYLKEGKKDMATLDTIYNRGCWSAAII
mmetsp:Transcript_29246/g.40197  ORF Transcript_29246/g.40197 Transcript_29246/m.40197 type:complete len:159 (+) Transcript_29246:477-953(+)